MCYFPNESWESLAHNSLQWKRCILVVFEKLEVMYEEHTKVLIEQQRE